MKTATFSDFVRQPTQVLARAAGDDILLTRRGEEDLIVSPRHRHESDADALNLLSRLIAATLRDDVCDRMAQDLESELPWLAFLAPHERRAFVGEYFRTARACASVGDFRQLTIAVEAWKETAAAYAAGLDSRGADLHFLEEPEVVLDPRSQ